MSTTIQIRKRGSLTIPSKLREKYKLVENDPVTLVDLGEGFFISPKQSLLPKLVGEVEQLRKKLNISLEDLMLGISRERNE